HLRPAPARAHSRSAPEGSACPKTRRLADAEIDRGQLPTNENDSRGTEESSGRVGNLCAALGQASSADRADVRAINVRSSQRSADRDGPEGARYRWRKRRAIVSR